MKRNCNPLIAVLIVMTFIIASVPLFTVQADYGTNWQGAFYPSTDLTGTGVSVSGINGLNFNWGTGVPVVNGMPVPGIGADNFSARFTSIQYLAPGKYNFVVSSDDGVRLYINGAIVLDKFIGRPLVTDTVSVSIPTSPVSLVVEYFEGTYQAILQVQWFLVTAYPITATPTFPVPVRNYFEVSSIPLSWNRITWAVGYKVQVATDQLFTHIVWTDGTLSTDTLSINTPYLNSGVYYWRVQAKVNATTWGGWSVFDRFTIQAQLPITQWTGTFFPSNDLTGTGVPVSNISALNFSWGAVVPDVNGVPVSGIPADNFSARFTRVQIFGAGKYTFVATSDDGIRITIDGAVVLDKFVAKGLTQDTFNMTLTGEAHTLVVEYFDSTNNAELQVQWSPI